MDQLNFTPRDERERQDRATTMRRVAAHFDRVDVSMHVTHYTRFLEALGEAWDDRDPGYLEHVMQRILARVALLPHTATGGCA